MSTDGTGSRRARNRRRRGRIFLGTFAVVTAALVVVGAVGAAASNGQGPRATAVQVDPGAAAAASGARLIVTMNQSLEKISPNQVQITPAAPFTVATAGRSMGVRFTLPLHDDTAYTVRFTGVRGLGGGPAAAVAETFRTPAIDLYLLQRGANGDAIVRTGVSGAAAVPVFRDPHIEDFRVTSNHLVVSLLDGGGHTRLVVTDLDGRHRRELKLPGTGTIAELQSADRGELIGYTYTDADIGTPGARDNALYTASVKDDDANAKPTAVPVTGKDPRVADWHFVPDTDSILVLTYDGRMLLSGASGKDAADLGTGVTIDGIARGSSVAVLQRADGMYTVDLTNGKQAPLVQATVGGRAVPGYIGVVTPLPGPHTGTSGFDTVQQFALIGDGGVSQGTTIYRVGGTGAAQPIMTVAGTDAVMQTCASPSGRYVAVLIAPDVAANPYDTYELPMPQKIVTHIVELSNGHEVGRIDGFDASWCQLPPALAQ